MIVLYYFGEGIVAVLGPTRFVTIYLVGGVFSSALNLYYAYSIAPKLRWERAQQRLPPGVKMVYDMPAHGARYVSVSNQHPEFY